MTVEPAGHPPHEDASLLEEPEVELLVEDALPLEDELVPELDELPLDPAEELPLLSEAPSSSGRPPSAPLLDEPDESPLEPDPEPVVADAELLLVASELASESME